jgi:hypothetical protein
MVSCNTATGTISGFELISKEAVGLYRGEDLASELKGEIEINDSRSCLTAVTALPVRWKGWERFRVVVRSDITMEAPDGDGSYEPKVVHTVENPHPDEEHAANDIGGSADTPDIFVRTDARMWKRFEWYTVTCRGDGTTASD